MPCQCCVNSHCLHCLEDQDKRKGLDMFCTVQCSSNVFRFGGIVRVESADDLSLQLLFLAEDGIACVNIGTWFALKQETHRVVWDGWEEPCFPSSPFSASHC